MKTVKLWCEKCKGERYNDLCDKCDSCDALGYRLVQIESMPHLYTLTDAQADAAVLSVFNDYERLDTIQICDAIIVRLHAFYCGRGEE